MISVLRTILLYPLSIIYGCITFCRNKLYDQKIFNSTAFNFPVISVGNLSLGGTGKPPHIEYLIRLLSPTNKIATLSRGYKRKTSGFIIGNKNSTIEQIGDEPLQYFLKFEKIIVAVDEKRVNGIEKIRYHHTDLSAILLDDAFQHRAVSPGLNILITEYNQLYCDDLVIPAGRLREWPTGSTRANLIIVSKSPKELTTAEREKTINALQPKKHQSVYFSFVQYGELRAFTKKAKEILILDKIKTDIILLTGIAKPTPLIKKLSKAYNSLQHIKYSDHHSFTISDIKHIAAAYEQLNSNNKIIITTEKDIMRLSLPSILNEIPDIPIFYIPIEICFHGNDKKEFDRKILDYVATN